MVGKSVVTNDLSPDRLGIKKRLRVDATPREAA